MKKFINCFSLCLLLVSASLMAQPAMTNHAITPPTSASQINWLKTYSEAVSASQSTSKPILILFTGSTWCPACMTLEREVISNPEFAQAVGQKFIFLKAEFPSYGQNSIMASPFKPLMDRYNVEAFPTFVVVNGNGQRLYTVNYREGGPRAYAQELLQKLNQQNPSDGQGYYR